MTDKKYILQADSSSKVPIWVEALENVRKEYADTIAMEASASSSIVVGANFSSIGDEVDT